MGVVADKLIDVPFEAVLFLATETHLLSTSTDEEVWTFDFKEWHKVDMSIGIPSTVTVVTYQNSTVGMSKIGDLLLFAENEVKIISGAFLCT